MNGGEYKICLACLELKPISKFREGTKGYFENICKYCGSRHSSAKRKLEMLENLGWKCVCCGEDNPQFLSIDHINGGGCAHKRELNTHGQEYLIAAIKREGWPKDKYQILCMNCNTAKGYYGVCPHQVGLTSEMVIKDLRSRVLNSNEALEKLKQKVTKIG